VGQTRNYGHPEPRQSCVEGYRDALDHYKNLGQWAETVQARTSFSGLVADLIRATATSVTSIRFPSGDNGQLRGFDGALEAEGAPPYVPQGKSIWEFGVTDGGAAKATSDYTKRTEQRDEAARKETTFVFVSPRTWDKARLQTSAKLERASATRLGFSIFQ
jgi:hypothetical protein